MNRGHQVNRFDETLQSISHHWEQRREAAASRLSSPDWPHALTIALSREVGTQGTAVGQAVGSLLGWPVYDRELLERIAQDMGVQKSLLDSVDEKGMGWLEEVFTSFMAVPFVTDGAYVQHLVKTILALGSHGECVIVGRGAAFILPAATTLRVRLVAPLKDRIATMSRKLSISPAEATRQIEAVEQERNSFIDGHFFKNPSELHNFNLVLDFARFGIDGCAQVIAEATRHLQRKLQNKPDSNAATGK